MNKSSLTRARQRLGWPVMRELFRPWPYCWATGRNSPRATGLALDGMLLGRPRLARQPGNVRQVRLATQSDGLSAGPGGRGVGVLVARDGGRGDRGAGRTPSGSCPTNWKPRSAGHRALGHGGLWGLARWHRFRDRDADPLWRIERRAARRVQDSLPDGSYLARIQANKHAKAAGTVKAPPALVRVIEYRVDGQAEMRVIRLVTSLTDHEEYPAAELATLYARRWEAPRSSSTRSSTHQRGRPVLRSQTPDGSGRKNPRPPDRPPRDPRPAQRGGPDRADFRLIGNPWPVARRPRLAQHPASPSPKSRPSARPCRDPLVSPATTTLTRLPPQTEVVDHPVQQQGPRRTC